MQHQQGALRPIDSVPGSTLVKNILQKTAPAMYHAEHIRRGFFCKIPDTFVYLSLFQFVMEGVFDFLQEVIDGRIDTNITGACILMENADGCTKGLGDSNQRTQDCRFGNSLLIHGQYNLLRWLKGVAGGNSEYRYCRGSNEAGGDAAQQNFA